MRWRRYLEWTGTPLVDASGLVTATLLRRIAGRDRDARKGSIISEHRRVIIRLLTNRWSLKPEIGFSKAFGRWTVELAPGVTFYTDNGDFFGGQTRGVAPLYSVQAHVGYTFTPGCWLALNAGYFVGGRTTVDGVENDDEQQGMRFGATVALPVNRYHSVKLYGITGYNAFFFSHCEVASRWHC